MSVKKFTWNFAWLVLGILAVAIASFSQNSALPANSEGQPATGSKAREVRADVKTASKPAAEADPLSYTIGVEDELGISVWHEPDLSTNAVVRPDGMITMPLLNDLKVSGMTPKELQDVLTMKLKDYVKEPQVTVVVRQIRSRRVYLMGEVVRPGTYALNNSKTVLQLLAEAGGPGTYAKLGGIYVIRQQDGNRTRLPFHYKKAMSGKKMSEDIVLQPGDMVVVP